jgi:cellulose synthase/poly-beta-1,6-N-acetylglucosamine synthase-like glycosyltransferase
VLSSILAISSVATATSLIGLLAVGARWRRRGLWLCAAYAALVIASAWAAGRWLWELPLADLWTGAGLTFTAAIASYGLRKDWNPAGQTLFGTMALTSAAFVLYAVHFTISEPLPLVAYPTSLVLIGLEVLAFVLLLVATHETLDTAARVRWRRPAEPASIGLQPFVSVHVPTHNEPPELVLETLRALRALDYPSYEVIVIDNNTEDSDLWQPVARYCEEVGFRFVHLENWPGFKAGALNHALEILDPRTTVISVVDADFVVEPDFLERTVGYFGDPGIGFVQTRQAFRSEAVNGYLRRLELAYRTFDEISMPSRNERNALIFAGTMGLIRRKALVEAGGWGEWCVTEDAELSIRILALGYDSLYVEESFGTGVMPLTFAALKRQRFRWCLGGVQLLRAHWRLMMSGKAVSPEERKLGLTRGQRYDYLAAALQWFQAPLTLAFALFLVAGVTAEALGWGTASRPLAGFFVTVPFLLLMSSLMKAFWGLRVRLETTWGDALAVMGIFLSLTWAVALGCLRGISGRGMAFLRTPKFKEKESFKQALQSTRAETPLAILLTAGAGVSAATQVGIDAVFLTALCAWTSLLFWSAPVTAFVAARMELRSAALAGRRQLESARTRIPLYRRPPSYAWATVAACALLATMAPSVALGPGGSVIADALPLGQVDQADAGSSDNDGPGHRARRGHRNYAQPALRAGPVGGLARARDGKAGNGTRRTGSEGPTSGGMPGSQPRGTPDYPTRPVSQPKTSTPSEPQASPPTEPQASPRPEPQASETPSSQPGGAADYPTSQAPQTPASPSPDHPTGPPAAYPTGPPDGTPRQSPR